MSLHHSDAANMDAFPSHFLSLSLPNFQHQVSQSHVLTNVSPSVTVTPVGLPPQSVMTSHSSLKGIVLPTQPLPPDQALGDGILAAIDVKDLKPIKKIKSENVAEATFVKCEFCDYCCDKKDRLSRHVRIVHYKEKPFMCNMCEYSTGRKDKLKRHQSTVHSQERPFKCEFCAHTSSRKDKLREHVQGVHYKNRPKRPKKKYPKKKKTQQPAPQQQQQQQQQLQQHQIVVAQSTPSSNGVTQILTTAGNISGVTMAQLPINLVPVSVSASGIPTHYQIKHHPQAHHVNLLS